MAEGILVLLCNHFVPLHLHSHQLFVPIPSSNHVMLLNKLFAAVPLMALSMLPIIVCAAPDPVPSPRSYPFCVHYEDTPENTRRLSKTNRGAMKSEGNARFPFTNRAGKEIFQVSTNPSLEIQTFQEGVQKQYAINIVFNTGMVPTFRIGSFDHCKETAYKLYNTYIGYGWEVTSVYYYEIV
jgi:hypothetical protein